MPTATESNLIPDAAMRERRGSGHAVFYRSIIPCMGFLLSISLLWVPFGFKTTGIYEEWVVESALQTQNLFFLTDNASQASHRVRPLEMLPHTVANLLTPDSFVGYSVLLYFIFLGKAVVTYGLLRRLLPNQRGLAFLTSLLFVLFPADSGLFTFRAIHVHGAIFLLIVAIYLLVVYWQRPRRVILGGLWLSLAASILMYENAYPLIAVVPILLIYLARKVERRIIWVSALWYAVPVITAVRMIILYQSGTTYENLVVGSGATPNMLMTLFNAYARITVTGWQDALKQFDGTYLPQVILIVIISLLGVWLLDRTTQRTPAPLRIRSRRYIWLFMIGFGFIGLGYATYLISYHYSTTTMRTFLLASWGGAICVGCAVALLLRKQLLVSGLLALLIGIAASNALKNHEYYYNISLDEQRFLGQMVEQVRALPTARTLVIIDDTEYFDLEDRLGAGAAIPAALNYLYQTSPVNVQLCHPYSTPNAAGVKCFFKKDGLFISDTTGEHLSATYDKTLIFDYTVDHDLKLLLELPSKYVDSRAIPFTPTYDLPAPDLNIPLPRRALTIFNCWPIEPCTSHAPLQKSASFVVDFGDTIPGVGWRNVEVAPTGENFRWTIYPESNLYIWLNADQDYAFELSIWATISPPGSVNSLTVKVNGEPLPLTQSDDRAGFVMFRGTIPRAAIAEDPAKTVLTFSSNLVPIADANLGLPYHTLKIEPITAKP